MKKVCSNCKQEKNLQDFSKDKHAPDKHNYKCKQCSVKLAREWNLAHPIEVRKIDAKRRSNKPWVTRDRSLRINFGINSEQYCELLKNQNGRCANPGCRSEKPSHNRKNFAVDHEHIENYSSLPPEEKKKYIRGLLCHYCNVGLGHFFDDFKKLEGIIEYLKLYIDSKVDIC